MIYIYTETVGFQVNNRNRGIYDELTYLRTHDLYILKQLVSRSVVAIVVSMMNLLTYLHYYYYYYYYGTTRTGDSSEICFFDMLCASPEISAYVRGLRKVLQMKLQTTVSVCMRIQKEQVRTLKMSQSSGAV